MSKLGRKPVDITRQIFGRLTAKEPTERMSNGTKYWLCECVCGNKKEVLKTSLIHGRIKSCGCITIENGKKRWGPGSSHWKGGRTTSSQGYTLLYKPGHPNATAKKHYVAEHIYNMSESLGRALEKGEIVHHKNGIKKDNRIENLELWTTSHPKGQRIEDMIDWCHEYLKEYAPNLLYRGNRENSTYCQSG